MIIDTKEVINWAEKEKVLFEAMPYSEFNDGIRAGMEMAIVFIQLYEKHLGEDIAKSRGEE